MTSRKYVICVTSLLYVFMLLNLVLWHCLVKQPFTQGDLNRVGSFTSTEPLTQNVKYSKHHVSLREYISSGKHESFDVITIGDSFTNGGGHNYYQDYLEERYGIRTLNMRFRNHCLTDLYILIKSGMLEEIKPKVVIIESVGRRVQDRLGRIKIDSEEFTQEEAESLIMTDIIKNNNVVSFSSGLLPSFAVNVNANFICNKLYHLIRPERLSFGVYTTELNRKFFTNPGYEHTLIYVRDDLRYLNSPVKAETVNMNLNNAARILREKSIMLVFMPCADKYDLYYLYIINHNGRPENQFFHDMRRVSPKDYVFIDTMKILREALERGEQDIYWFGDTHWSFKGAELVCDELVKYFDWLN